MTWVDVLIIFAKTLVVISIVFGVVLLLTYLERKFLARIQMRMGPMRTGPQGILQPLADTFKLLLKEDLLPAQADKLVFWLAPLAVAVPALVVWITIPFAPQLVVRNLSFGLFYFVAFSVLSIVGMIAASWASSNRYALLGGARAAAQLVSYEIPLILALLSVTMAAGSLNLTTIVEQQETIPYLLIQPLAFLLFFVASLAESARTPFDIPQAESELVGGPFVEYSGMHWAMFFLTEYANTFLVGALGALLFLGGWLGPILPPVIWFLLKTFILVFAIFWMRGTFPRLRVDQLMSLAWKVLIPLGFLNMLLLGFQVYYRLPSWSMTLASILVIAWVGWVLYRRQNRILAAAQTIHLIPAREERHAGTV